MAAITLKRAVSLNPFQWSSFEAICHMKEDISAKETFFRSVASKVGLSDGHSEDENEEDVPDEDVDMPADDDTIPSPSIPSLPPSPVKMAAPKLLTRRTDKANFGENTRFGSLKICTDNSLISLYVSRLIYIIGYCIGNILNF